MHNQNFMSNFHYCAPAWQTKKHGAPEIRSLTFNKSSKYIDQIFQKLNTKHN